MNRKRWLLAAVFASLNAAAAPKWTVPGATVCVEVSVESSPSDPRLGVFVKIPDGGMLPEPYAVPQAYTVNGEPLETVIFGYDKKDGVGVLFAEPPDGGKAHVYFSAAQKPPSKPPEGTLFPSLVLFTRSGKGSLDIAKSLQSCYPYGQDAGFDDWKWCGSMVNPFGPDDHYSLWFVGGFILEKPERIWFATVSDEGSEVLIDGRRVAAWSGVHTRKQGAKGQHGSFVQLDKGLHRFDYFQFELTGKQEAQLVWKRPGVKTKTGLPEMLTGFAKSGRGRIGAVRYKDGRVCGTIALNNQRGIEQPVSYFWFGERPVNLFTVTAHGVPEGANATLEFGKDKKIKDPVASWLAVGRPDELSVPVTLSVENAVGAARVTRWLRSPWTPAKASMEKPGDRLAYRRAFLCMANAVPPPGDPCADWASDLWGLLVELMEPYKGGPLLKRLFEDGFASLQKRPDWQRWKLEDRFIESLRLQKDGERLLSWIARLEKAERDGARKFHWKAERVRSLLLDFARPDVAAREINALKENASGPEQTQIALLRAGDVARALGKSDEALKFYRDAEENYRAHHKAGKPAATSVAPAGRGKGAKKGAPAAPVARFKLPAAPKGEEWKTYTVRNASMYKTILSQLEQGAFAEALGTLRTWEDESPTGKQEGEYTMAEARVYRALGDSRRAVNALDVYVRNTVMTAELADAMKLEAECLNDLNETARRRALAKDFLKRFPGHPYGEEMERMK